MKRKRPHISAATVIGGHSHKNEDGYLCLSELPVKNHEHLSFAAVFDGIKNFQVRNMFGIPF